MKVNRFKKGFIKNIAIILVPVILPVMVLGGFAIMLTERYIYETVRQNNETILRQTENNIGYLLDEINNIYLNYRTNPDITYRLRKIFNTETIDKDDYNLLNAITNSIKIPLYDKNYIHSLYLYFENDKGRFFTTTEGIILDNIYYDTQWKTTYDLKKNSEKIWTESRVLKPYAFEEKGTEVITLYQLISTNYKNQKDTGVVVINIHKNAIENILKNIEVTEGHSIFIVDENYQVLFKNGGYSYLEEDMMRKIFENSNTKFFEKDSIRIEDDCFEIAILEIEAWGWRICSIIPKDIMYKVPDTLKKVLVILVSSLIVLGIIINYLLMRYNSKKLQKVIALLDSEEIDENSMQCHEEEKDEYSYINNRIIENFVMQKYLRIQLSERKYKLKTYELLALQAQINPHFLYNTLETIYWKSFQFTKKPNDITYMIENLSDVLKYSLHHKKQQVTFNEEIKYTKSYIEIQKLRYRNKFQVIWKYDEEVLQYRAVQLILQPLIENAIYHGIKEKEGGSIIRIKIEKKSQDIAVSILDTGIGIDRGRVKELNEQLEEMPDIVGSIGLLNTNKRLKLLYGNESGVKIQSKKGMGTHIYFKIPIAKIEETNKK